MILPNWNFSSIHFLENTILFYIIRKNKAKIIFLFLSLCCALMMTHYIFFSRIPRKKTLNSPENKEKEKAEGEAI